MKYLNIGTLVPWSSFTWALATFRCEHVTYAQKGEVKTGLKLGWGLIHFNICDQDCKNRACGHMIFAYFFNLSELITSYPNMIWQRDFQHLIWFHLALWCRLQIVNILFQCWNMTFRVMGCSLCPNARFSQARPHL